MRNWFRSLFPTRPRGPLVVNAPRAESRRGVSRISLEIDGSPLWFESSDVELTPSTEAFATALATPALSAGRPLEIRGPVCSVWHQNHRRAVQLTSSWWNFPAVADPPAPPLRTATASSCSAPPRGAALCFTGGVDSFFTLLRAKPTADWLVFALGYDVDLRDRRLVESAEQTVRAVARETQKNAAVIRTNLRRHRAFRKESWERTHGGALGAIGHLLNGCVDLLQISSSQTYGSSTYWGSRWDLDPLFASSTLAIQHFGAELLRTEKLWQIADVPLVQRHLRVCWVRHAGAGNCGRCEKCIRTMLVLETCGQLERYSSLGKRSELAARIDGVESIPWGTLVAYDALRKRDMPAAVRSAVERLLERTRLRLLAAALKQAA